MAEIRVEISEKASRSMVAFLRDPDTDRVIVLLRLRPVMPVEEFVHEAIHILQVTSVLGAGHPLPFDLAAQLEREAREHTTAFQRHQ